MAESRYEQLVRTELPRHAAGQPVILEAGALLRDKVSGSVFAQLKFCNVEPEPIKAISVSVIPLDVTGARLGESAEQDYLDFTAGIGESFGDRTAVRLPNDSSRGFDVALKRIVYADNRTEEFPESVMQPLAGQKSLVSELGEELAEQYRLDVCKDARYVPAEYPGGLWACACGTVNGEKRDACYKCGTDRLRQLEANSRERLERRRNERLEEEEYNSAVRDMESNDLAVPSRVKKVFEKLGGYRSAAENLQKCRDRIASLERKRKTSVILAAVAAAAIAAFFIVTKVVIPDNSYNAALELMNAGKYEEAVAAFEALDGYKDSAKLQASIKAENELLLAKVGDIVCFGSYEQDNNKKNGKEDIEWLVLDKQGNKLLLLSEYGLDCQEYNAKETDITWEKCTLRGWLNGAFLNEAFSAEEQKRIETTKVSADKNPKHNTNPGSATEDKVFLLSITEAEKYFTGDWARKCKPTAYSKARGVWISDETNCCCWWLRSPGDYQYSAADVISDGGVYYNGLYVNYDGGTVRPALWIDPAS